MQNQRMRNICKLDTQNKIVQLILIEKQKNKISHLKSAKLIHWKITSLIKS